jgi:hypothetical protein
MTPAVSDISIERGASFSKTFQFTLTDSGLPFDLTGYAVIAQVRETETSTNRIATFTCSINAPSTQGYFTVYLSKIQTAAMRFGSFRWDLFVTHPTNGTDMKLLAGKATVVPNVTHDGGATITVPVGTVSGSAEWGNIVGSVSAQSDLNAALNERLQLGDPIISLVTPNWPIVLTEPGAGNAGFAPGVRSQMIDLTDLTTYAKSGLNVYAYYADPVPIVGTPVIPQITGIAVKHYSPPDRGGDVSGIFVLQEGGGNGISVYNKTGFEPIDPTTGLHVQSYPNDGRAIEASVNGLKHCIVSTSENGIAYWGKVTGTTGTGVHISTGSGVNDTQHAFEGLLPNSATVSSYITFAGNQYLKGALGVGIAPAVDLTAPQILVKGSGQLSPPSVSTNLGATLGLQSNSVSNGGGGMVMFGESHGFFCAVKGILTNGTNVMGDMGFYVRATAGDDILTEAGRFTSASNLICANVVTAKGFTLDDAAASRTILVGTTNGTTIGSSTSSKLSFHGVTPIVQPTGSVLTALSNLGLIGSPTINFSELTGTIGAGQALVSSVAGRTGAITLAQADVAGLTTASSPSFTNLTTTNDVTTANHYYMTGASPFIGATTTGAPLRFGVNPSGTAIEVARFTASGGLNLVNTTTDVDDGSIFVVKVYYNSTLTVFDAAGSGTPEGAVAAAVGSTYRRTNGGAGTTLYVKESGTGNTGWIGK